MYRKPIIPLATEETSQFLGMTLADYSAHRKKHPQALREEYRALFRQAQNLQLPAITRQTVDPHDGTQKFCLPIPNQKPAAQPFESESVIIPMTSFGGTTWFTLCISSQIGCRMACSFCETGRMGLLQNLTPGQIVQQRLVARKLRTIANCPLPIADLNSPSSNRQSAIGDGQSSGQSNTYFSDGIQNIVFMGMGEPLDNLDHVIQAIRVFHDPAGLNFPLTQITVSTVGRIDGLKKLGELCQREPNWKNLRIAISLNAATDSLRDSLMPVNKAMPLAALKQTLRDYPLAPRARFLIEYVLIKSINDSPQDAASVADFCRDLPCIVNLIPYNPQRYATYETPTDDTILQFMQTLKSHNLFVKRRTTHGRNLMGACGQLGNPTIRRLSALPKSAIGNRQ